jgi:glycosyltransferase involved in cell wall biosynthesis
MIIAVNTRLLIGNLHGGIEWFTYEILKRVVKSHPEHSFIFIFDRPFDKRFVFAENVKAIPAPPRAKHPIIWHWWNHRTIPSLLKKSGADIYISPDGMIPTRLSIPSIPVIHDISFIHRPKDIPLLKSLYYRKLFPRYAAAASRIMTVSEFSASDISETLGIDRSKIDVVFNGVSEEFYSDIGPVTDIIPQLSEERSYFLFVGNLSPRKNVPNTIRAFNRYRETSNNDHILVISGERFFLNSEADREYKESPFKDDIIFTGPMNRSQLRRLYSNALALLFIPWFEGFGIPVIEAMRCGTPVITSDTSSLPEVSGDAAILVSPDNIEEISNVMKMVVSDLPLRETLISKGYANASKFSWDSTAELFWNSIEKTIKNR